MRIGQAEESGKYPCGVCRQGVGDNSIKCIACHKWIHKRCSGRLRWFGHLEHKSVDDWVSALSFNCIFGQHRWKFSPLAAFNMVLFKICFGMQFHSFK